MNFKTYITILIILFCASFILKAQSENDSLFFFDYRFNCTSEDNAKWQARKEKIHDSLFIVHSKRTDTSRFLKEGITDKYTIVSPTEFIIQRSFSKKGIQLPGEYRLNITVKDTVNEMFVLHVVSNELNIIKSVQSKTLIPICPVVKTIFYHDNNLKSEVYYHDSNLDTIWNSRGEVFLDIHTEDNASMPILENYPELSFKRALGSMIQEHLEYPPTAMEANISGKVYVSFIVTYYGGIECIKVLKGVHPLLDSEVVRFINKLKIKTPGLVDGKPVDLRLTLPFSFNLQ